jgi:hypothetical protein
MQILVDWTCLVLRPRVGGPRLNPMLRALGHLTRASAISGTCFWYLLRTKPAQFWGGQLKSDVLDLPPSFYFLLFTLLISSQF